LSDESGPGEFNGTGAGNKRNVSSVSLCSFHYAVDSTDTTASVKDVHAETADNCFSGADRFTIGRKIVFCSFRQVLHSI